MTITTTFDLPQPPEVGAEEWFRVLDAIAETNPELKLKDGTMTVELHTTLNGDTVEIAYDHAHDQIEQLGELLVTAGVIPNDDGGAR